ncbi:hypothetical protein EMCRGX_G016870 [Ephydatia muelleri]
MGCRKQDTLIKGVMVASAVVSPNSNEVPVRILNPRDEKVVLKKGTQIASMELLEQDPVMNISTVMKNHGVSLECQNILWEMVSKARREELRALLKDMLESNVFQQSDSLWSSPIVGYWQVEVAPEDQPKTAFTTLEGLYHFKLTQIMSDASYSTQMLVTLESVPCCHRLVVMGQNVLSPMRADRLLGQNRDIIYSGENSLFELTTDLWSGYGISKNRKVNLARWLERLQEYNFTVVHRQGLRHCNADALSRIPCRQCGRDEAKNTAIVGVIITNPFQKYTPAEMRQMQMDDTTIQPVHLAVSCGERRTPDVLKSWDRSSRLLMEHWHALCICDGILWKKCVDGSRRYKQLVLPDRLQEEALRDLHQGAVGGHIGEEKMIHRLKERLYWPGCTEAVREWCRNCRSCATRKTTAPKRRAHLQTINAGYPMQIKAATPYRKGPFKIMERLGEATYKITSLHGRRKSTIVHFDRLKPCVVPDVDDHTQSPENNILAEQVDRHRPVGTNLGLLDSDGETRVEPAEPVEAAPGIVVLPPLDEQRRYPVPDIDVVRPVGDPAPRFSPLISLQTDLSPVGGVTCSADIVFWCEIGNVRSATEYTCMNTKKEGSSVIDLDEVCACAVHK